MELTYSVKVYYTPGTRGVWVYSLYGHTMDMWSLSVQFVWTHHGHVGCGCTVYMNMSYLLRYDKV